MVPSSSIRVMLAWGTIKPKADSEVKLVATTITTVRRIIGQFTSIISRNLQDNLLFYYRHLFLELRSISQLDPTLSSALNSVGYCCCYLFGLPDSVLLPESQLSIPFKDVHSEQTVRQHCYTRVS